MTFRVIVTGCRDWTDPVAVDVALHRAIGRFHDQVVVVHGGCPTGADKFAADFCKRRGIASDVHAADWDKHGRAAGPIRNREMAEAGASQCLAFWDGKSTGTLDMIKQATAHGIPVRIVPKGKP
jgi:hypothetical protein